MVDLDDIQGIVVRGYGMPSVSHLVLQITSPTHARAWIGKLTASDNGLGTKIATGVPWHPSEKPPTCANIGFTHKGMRQLGLSQDSLRSFPDDFSGFGARIAKLLDRNQDVLGSDAHLVMSVFARSEKDRRDAARVIKHNFSGDSAFRFLRERVGNRLPGNKVHFGFRDNISQPRVKGFPQKPNQTYRQKEAPTGQFVLGHDSQWDEYKYPVPQPKQLGFNGSYAAYLVLEQRVAEFYQFLNEAARKTGLSAEHIAAKLCGRWADGTPLIQSAVGPGNAGADEGLNDFVYADDQTGTICPCGSHIRRAYPRDDKNIRGITVEKRRIIRRGIPYGSAFDSENPNDSVERGLLAMFIGASLSEQFEFVVREWMSSGSFSGQLRRKSRDPFFPYAAGAPSKFAIPQDNDRTIELDLPSIVGLRELVYLFLPSISSLKYISTLDA